MKPKVLHESSAHYICAAAMEVNASFHLLECAASDLEARDSRRQFVDKERKLAPTAADSLLEAGEELLPLYRFPVEPVEWVRTTNGF